MGRDEFIEILQRTLAGSLNSNAVADNVRYYQEYIDTQIRSGGGEGAVIVTLGDPRLLAKTIIEASKHTGIESEIEVSEVYEDGEAYKEEQGGNGVFRIPGWLLVVIVVFILIIIFGIVTSLLSFLLPFLLPIFCVVLVLQLIQRRR